MSEVGSIEAVLKLNASSFQSTLSQVSKDVSRFIESFNALDKTDVKSGFIKLDEILNLMRNSLRKLNDQSKVIDLFHRLSVGLKNTSSSFESFIKMTRLSENESKKLSEFINNLKTNLVNLFQELQKVATGESELGNSFKDLITLATNLKTALDNVKTELTTIKKDFETLHGSVDKNRTSFNSMDKEVDESKSHFQQLNNQLKESNNKLSQIASTSKKTASSLGYLGNALRNSFSNIFNNITSSISQSITETYKSKSEMNSWMDMLGLTTSQTNKFNSALDETVKKFQRVNKYQMGETIASIGVEFGLTEKQMEKALDVTSMITNEYLRAGRNSNEASLAVKDILQGQFQRLSRETGVKQEDLVATGKWDGEDTTDVMGIMEALEIVGKSRNWDVIAQKASSINDILTIGQNKISVWSADLIDRFTPALTGAFNKGMLVLEEFMKIANGVLDWLGGDGWGQTAVKIGGVVTAVMGLTNALIHYRTGASLLQISQMGLKDSILSTVLGLDAEKVAVEGSVKAWKMRLTGLEAEKVAEMGLHEAILAKLLGVDQEILKEGGLVEAINASIVAKKESTVASVEETLAEEGLGTSLCQMIIDRNAEMIATNQSTVAKQRSKVSTAELKFEEIGFTGVLKSKLVQLRYNILGINSDSSAKIRNKFVTVEGKSAELGLIQALKLKVSALSKNTAEHLRNTASKIREIATNNRLVSGISGLIGRKTAETVATDANTVASNKNTITKIREAIAENGLIGSIRNVIASRIGATVATDANNASNIGFIAGLRAVMLNEALAEGATVGLTGAIGALTGVMLANPAGLVALAILALASAFFVLTGGLDSSWAKMKKFNEMVKDTDSALEPYKEHLEQIKKEHGEGSTEYANASSNLEKFKNELKESEEVYNKADSAYQTLGTSLNDYSQEILKSTGFSSDFCKEQDAMNNALEIGKNKYQQAYDNMQKSTEAFKEEYKDMAKTLKEAGWDDAGDYLSKFQGNEQSLMEHQYQAETAEDWFGWFWNSLLAGIDSFWIEWDKFWMDVALRFQEDGLVGVLSDAFNWIWESLSPILSGLWDGLVGLFTDHDWDADIQNALSFIGSIPEKIMHFLFGEDKSGTGQAVQDWVNGIIPWITNGLMGLGGAVVDALTGFGEDCKNRINQWLIDAPKTILGDPNETWGSLWDKFVEWIRSGLSYLPNKLKEFSDYMQELYEGFDEWAQGITDGLKEQISNAISNFDLVDFIINTLFGKISTIGDIGFGIIDIIGSLFGFDNVGSSIKQLLYDNIVAPFLEFFTNFLSDPIGTLGGLFVDTYNFIGSLFGFDDAGTVMWQIIQDNIISPLQELLTLIVSDPIGTLGGIVLNPLEFLSSIFGFSEGNSVGVWVNEHIITPLSDALYNGILQIPVVGDIVELLSTLTDDSVGADEKGKAIGDAIGNGLTFAIGKIPVVGGLLKLLEGIPSVNPTAKSNGNNVGTNVNDGYFDGTSMMKKNALLEFSDIAKGIIGKAREGFSAAASYGAQVWKGLNSVFQRHSPGFMYHQVLAEFGTDIPSAISSSEDTAYSNAQSYGQTIVDGVSGMYNNMPQMSMDFFSNGALTDYQTDANTVTTISGDLSSNTTNAFATMQTGVEGSVNTMTGNVNAQYSNMQLKQNTMLNSMKNSNLLAYNQMQLQSNQSLMKMRDDTSKVTTQMISAWSHMKTQLVATANSLRSESTSHFNQLSSTIGSFYRKIQNPSNWGAGASTNVQGKSPRPSVGRRIASSFKHHGAGSPSTYKGQQVMSLRQLKRTICPNGECGSLFDGLDLNDKVNVQEFLSSITGEHGFGSWSGWNNIHYNHIKNKSDDWTMKSPQLLGRINTDADFKVGDFENGTPKISFGSFVKMAEALFSEIPYRFYYDSAWKGSWLGAIQAGACNCADGTDALLAFARTCGFDGSRVHGYWGDEGHFWAVINGKTMDTTAWQKGYGWTGPAQRGAGTPNGLKSRHNSSPSSEGKVVNVTIDMSGSVVYGVDDLDSKIELATKRAMREEFNDPFTVAL